MTVYFIQESDGGCVKIGYTRGRVASRLVALQISTPRKLILLSEFGENRSYEQYLHALFREYHVCGEWFRPEGRFRYYLDNVAIPLNGAALDR